MSEKTKPHVPINKSIDGYVTCSVEGVTYIGNSNKSLAVYCETCGVRADVDPAVYFPDGKRCEADQGIMTPIQMAGSWRPTESISSFLQMIKEIKEG